MDYINRKEVEKLFAEISDIERVMERIEESSHIDIDLGCDRTMMLKKVLPETDMFEIKDLIKQKLTVRLDNLKYKLKEL